MKEKIYSIKIDGITYRGNKRYLSRMRRAKIGLGLRIGKLAYLKDL